MSGAPLQVSKPTRPTPSGGDVTMAMSDLTLLEPLLGLLRRHAARASDAHELAMTAETIRFVETQADCLLRSQASGHLTGSAWLLNAGRTRTLLTHDRKLE